MKNFINNILRRMIGYQLVKFDSAPYTFRKSLYAFLEQQSPHGKILDIGSARNNYPKERLGKENVTTLDLEPPADVIGNVMALPFADNTFDCVICLETLEHVEDPRKALIEIHRVLVPGGKFIGSAPFAYELHGEEYGDYWRFTRQGWENLLTHFKEVSITPFAGKESAPGWYFVTARK
ncbi:MAG: class I SAM-dependent methyltransferase [Patescibacteria group bacterium]|nr:class I SAM-dependent methyltransferase [Patescibacteria group bacterium]